MRYLSLYRGYGYVPLRFGGGGTSLGEWAHKNNKETCLPIWRDNNNGKTGMLPYHIHISVRSVYLSFNSDFYDSKIMHL